MLVRSVHSRRLVCRVVTLAACASALPLLTPRDAAAAPGRIARPRAANVRATPAKPATKAGKTDAAKRPVVAAGSAGSAGTSAGTADSASDNPIIVGGQAGQSQFFRSFAIGAGVVGVASGSALLLAHPAAAAAPAATGTTTTGTTTVSVAGGVTTGSTSGTATSGTATGGTTGASSTGGSTSSIGTAAPVPLPMVVPTVDVPPGIVTPEPATLALVGVGALALGGIARRRAL